MEKNSPKNTYNDIVVSLFNLAEEDVQSIADLLKSSTNSNSCITIVGTKKQIESMKKIKEFVSDRYVLFDVSNDMESSILKLIAPHSENKLLVLNGKLPPTINMYYNINPLKLSDNSKLHTILITRNEHKKETIPDSNYKYALVDFYAITDCDLPNLIKIINLKLSPVGRIILITKPGQFDRYIPEMASVVTKYSIMITTSEDFSYAMLKFINIKPEKNAKVLIHTHNNDLITAIVAHHSPEEVGFILDSKQKINRATLKTYDASVYSILSRIEGSVNRILKIKNDQEILSLRQLFIPPNVVSAIMDSLPCKYGELYEKLLNTELIRNESELRKIVACLTVRRKIYLRTSNDINNITIEKFEKR